MDVYVKKNPNPEQACVIWLHGLGADSSDMMNLVEQLNISEVALRHVFLDAPKRAVTLNGGMLMPAWYDILGFDQHSREDKEGIEQSQQQIKRAIKVQVDQGFDFGQIFLAGFSQGGAMALYAALTSMEPLAGVIALSAYLPIAAQIQPIQDKSLPVFIGSGQFDPLVLPQWTIQSKEWLIKHGYENVNFHQYPMEHTVCFEELKDLSLWLNRQFQGTLQ